MSAVIRQQAMRLVGQPVYAHHVSGQVYHGHLQSVTHTGIYLLPYQGQMAYVSATSSDKQISICEPHQLGTEEVEPVFAPALFFTFGTLLGLAAARPYYGYYGYPYYW